MSSRYSAARPKRAGEEFARTHHLDGDGPSSSKKPRFDVRNPSALAPDAPEEDAILEADVIGGGGAATKRGAVNLDGYDSDSDNEGFDGRAEERGKNKSGDVNLFEQLENYGASKNGKTAAKTDIEDDADMFADLEEEHADGDDTDPKVKTGKKKAVQFLDEDEIQGQVSGSKSGGHISANFALDPNGKLSARAMDDERESSEDEDDAELAAEEEGVDEEVGAGGLKKHAPRVDAFNMKSEQEEGRFDDAGNFVRKAADPDSVHDNWLDGLSKKEMKKAAAAHEKREEDRRQKQIEDDATQTSELLRNLILHLKPGETALEALARLGRGQVKTKKIPKWKLKKQQQKAEDSMDVDDAKAAEDPEQVRIREAVNSVTGAADQLLSRGQLEIYDQERQLLIRQYRRETGEDWIEPSKEELAAEGVLPPKMWEFRWVDGRDGGAKQGPYDGQTMLAWQDAGYFGEGVEFREVGDLGPWSATAGFI